MSAGAELVLRTGRKHAARLPWETLSLVEDDKVNPGWDEQGGDQ